MLYSSNNTSEINPLLVYKAEFASLTSIFHRFVVIFMLFILIILIGLINFDIYFTLTSPLFLNLLHCLYYLLFLLLFFHFSYVTYWPLGVFVLVAGCLPAYFLLVLLALFTSLLYHHLIKF